jgi:HEPN domain-containing protein/predicted nucleotidyltransferase
MADLVSTVAPQEAVLELIARTIADRLKPRRVILIGSRARGDARPDSDYDIVVEFDADPSAVNDLTGDVYSLFPDRRWSLNVIVRITGEIERSADDPGTIDWDIVRQGKIIFSANEGYELPTPGATRIRERPSQPPASVALWLELADKDLRVARLTMNEGGLWDHVCFSAQQSAEKYLKALLVRQHARPERTHVLTELLDDLRGVGMQLGDIDDDCALLAKYAVATRYGALRCDEPMAREALLAAERIAAAVRATI